MGDPSKPRKQWAKPLQVWQSERIGDEKALTKEFGLKNKKEIWRAEFMLRNFQKQAKSLIALSGPQVDTEKKQLMHKLADLGILEEDADLNSVLTLTVRDILQRRLQTIVFKKGLAKTPRQARQFISHELITVSSKTVAVPGILIKKSQEAEVEIDASSKLADPMHPERVQEKPKEEIKEVGTEESEVKEEKTEKKAKKPAKKAEPKEKPAKKEEKAEAKEKSDAPEKPAEETKEKVEDKDAKN